ncbi:hypothetical protein HYALB_00003541 [Hymenoscyphus albidus]|uniref:Uncharacterized protein n=1 Tax=Hymenoscyphus albidus TaxID=595503 RepID=A0A9N9M080_9HELO|nr:hypothetical protein HYALB_00003541 [Hymenoscyphus albidus]
MLQIVSAVKTSTVTEPYRSHDAKASSPSLFRRNRVSDIQNPEKVSSGCRSRLQPSYNALVIQLVFYPSKTDSIWLGTEPILHPSIYGSGSVSNHTSSVDLRTAEFLNGRLGMPSSAFEL